MMSVNAPRRMRSKVTLVAAMLLISGVAWGADYDATSPKAAFRSYTTAMAAADMDGLKTLVIAGPKHLKMLQTLANYNPVEARFRAAVIKAFPTAAKELPDPTQQTLKSIEGAQTKIDGDTATLQTRDSLTLVQLKKEGARWKIDVDSMFPEETVEDVVIYRKAMGDVMEALEDEIAAGKFKSFDELKGVLDIRVKMRLAMPPSADDPTTRPGL